jgi:hypothetical protein
MRTGFDMSTQWSSIGVNVVVEQLSGAAPTILIERVDEADEFAAEQEQVIQVSAQGRGSQLLYGEQIRHEGLELFEQTLTVAQIALVDLPGCGPLIHQAQRLGQGNAGGGVLHSRGAAGRGARTRVSSRHDDHHVTEPLLSLQGICV